MKKTKNIVLLVSFVFTIIFFILFFKLDTINNYCYIGGHCGFWLDIINSYIFTIFLYLSVTIFPFSLLTYFMKDEIFFSWIIFLCIWLPLSLIPILTTPDYGSGFLSSISDRGGVAIIMYLFFIII